MHNEEIYEKLRLKILDAEKLPSKKISRDFEGLIVRIKATHSGVINGNWRFYPPDWMKQSVDSFVKPFKKPVQIHHEDGKDPIGRILSAEYVDISDKVKSLKDYPQEAFSAQNISHNIVLKKQFLALKDDEDYEGLGYILLTAVISDKEAVEKIMDGRYLTVSVGMDPKHILCGHCGIDFKTTDFEDWCDHHSGKEYDGYLNFLIMGPFDYKEISPVNIPADPYATIELNNNEVFILRDELTCQNLMGDSFELQKVINLSTKEIFDTLNESKDIEKGEKMKKKEQIVNQESPKEKVQWDSVLEKSLLSEDEEFLLNDEEEELLYSELAKELEEDAKLPTAQRKKLPSSTFCGPGRSFPVADCPHFSAALRLLGRYKGPGDKDKIKACIMRKGRAMGCPGAKKNGDAQEDFFLKKCENCKENEKIIVDLEDKLGDLMEQVESLPQLLQDLEELKNKEEDSENQELASLIEEMAEFLHIEITEDFEIESIVKNIFDIIKQESRGEKSKRKTEGLANDEIKSLEDLEKDFKKVESKDTRTELTDEIKGKIQEDILRMKFGGASQTRIAQYIDNLKKTFKID